jgi:hypothetical protein
MKKVLIWIPIAYLLCLSASLALALEKRTGHGPVDQANAGARTITVNQEIYDVPIRCKARRVFGAIVPLAELRGAMRPGAALVPTNEIDFIRFEAVKKASGWEMVKITVLDGAAE